MSVFPRQKLTTKEKTTRDKITGKTPREASIDYLIDETAYHNFRDDILADYRLCDNGELEEKDYNYVLNPLNTTVDRYKKFGAKLRNYDIITPVLNLYAGEFGKRFKNVTVLSSSDKEENEYQKGLNKTLEVYYRKKVANELHALGIETGTPPEELPTIEEEINKYNLNFKSTRIITGQEILEYIKFDKDIDDKSQDAYGDWLRCGITVTYKGIFHNDIDYEVVPPWQMTIPTNIRSNFGEDCPWAVRRQIMSANEILDRWHDKLSDDDVTWLEEKNNDNISTTVGYTRLPTQYISSTSDYQKHSLLNEVQGIEVYHVQYRSFRQVGVLTYENEIGQITTKEVDDTYKLDKEAGDISIEWSWISWIEEGWRIGDVDRYIYLDVDYLKYNRMALNNKSKQKLSYNFRINRNISGKPISIPSVGRPYQVLYNIVKYQFEKMINKNKDKIAVIPQGIIPKGVGGWDEEKMMYYANAGSLMVIDETQPTAGIALQGIKVLDMSLGNYIKDSIEIMQSIKAEWWEAIGMNRQRYGDSMASDGKGVTEQAIFRSAIISEELNRKFEKFQEKDYAGLLDLSKLAYINGKKGKYINSEGREAFLNINPDDAVNHLDSDYDIHVINSAQETENIQMAKEYAFSMGQNADGKTMLELIGSKNFEKTKQIVAKIDRMAKEREDANNQAVLESNERIEESKRATQEAKNETERYKADRDYDKVLDAKYLEIANRPVENGNVETTDPETVRMNNHKITKENREHELSKEELAQRKKEGNQKINESKAKIKQMNTKTVNN